MTVYFERSEDTNAIEYGERIRGLRDAVVSYMEDLYNHGYLTGNHDYVPAEELIKNVREFILDEKDFVDEDAKNKWLLSQPGESQKKKFEESREEVIKMFRRLTCLEEEEGGVVRTWVKELWEARGH